MYSRTSYSKKPYSASVIVPASGGGGNKTVNLTGIAATGAIGLPTWQVIDLPTGLAATGGLGKNTPQITYIPPIYDSYFFDPNLSDANWNINLATLTSGQAAPDGTTSAFLVTTNIALDPRAWWGAMLYGFSGTSNIAPQTYNISCFVKSYATSPGLFALILNLTSSDPAGSYGAVVDPTTGNWTSAGGGGIPQAIQVTAFPNGWYQVQFQFFTNYALTGCDLDLFANWGTTLNTPVNTLSTTTNSGATGTTKGNYVWNPIVQAEACLVGVLGVPSLTYDCKIVLTGIHATGVINPPTVIIPSVSLPVGDLVIDFTNSIASGLIAAYVPSSYFTTEQIRDLTGIATNLAAPSAGSFSSSPEGVGYQTSAASSTASVLANATLQPASTFSVYWRGQVLTGGFTDNTGTTCILIGVSYDNTPSDSPYFAYALVGSVLANNDSGLAWSSAGTVGSSSAGYTPASVPSMQSLGGTFLVGGNSLFYQGGALFNTTSYGVSGPAYTGTSTICIGGVPGQTITSNTITNVAFIWNRVLSSTEMAALNTNPYQFLLPISFVGKGIVSTNFIPDIITLPHGINGSGVIGTPTVLTGTTIVLTGLSGSAVTPRGEIPSITNLPLGTNASGVTPANYITTVAFSSLGLNGSGSVSTNETPAVTFAPLGLNGSGVLGTLTISAGSSPTVVLTGVSGAGAFGSEIPTVTILPVGLKGSGVCSTGEIPNLTILPVGLSAKGVLGTPSVSTSGSNVVINPTGLIATGAIGSSIQSVMPGILLGVAASGAIGALSEQPLLFGLFGRGTLGILIVDLPISSGTYQYTTLIGWG